MVQRHWLASGSNNVIFLALLPGKSRLVRFVVSSHFSQRRGVWPKALPMFTSGFWLMQTSISLMITQRRSSAKKCKGDSISAKLHALCWWVWVITVRRARFVPSQLKKKKKTADDPVDIWNQNDWQLCRYFQLSDIKWKPRPIPQTHITYLLARRRVSTWFSSLKDVQSWKIFFFTFSPIHCILNPSLTCAFALFIFRAGKSLDCDGI